MAVIGFNVGSTISLGDISLAVEYLSDKNAFETDLQEIKERILEASKEKEKAQTKTG